mmetsp:Transcript_98201/g.316373  ORF Transcript_98201/g.316373 Transcript_98201/m.316373 type:complete len:258 (-) Transcript_98201:102-875(-)
MCQDKKSEAMGDEVFEFGSTEAEAEPASRPSCYVASALSTRPGGRPAPMPLQASAAEPRPQAPPPPQLPPSPKVLPSIQTSAALQSDAARAMAQRVTANAQTGGLMSLVSHLRADNTRLREALVAAQRECEALAAAQGQASEAAAAPGVDFGHLLELVRDFGADGLGGSEGDFLMEDMASQCQVFSMVDSPRGCEKDDEVVLLRDELEDSQMEVARLRAELAARDAHCLSFQVARLRAELAARDAHCLSFQAVAIAA